MELPAREKRYPHEGWEHIEIVLHREPETLNARSLALLSDEGLSQPGIFVKTSSPKGERERLPNPTLAVTDGNVTVKFHPGLSSRSSPAKRKHCERRSRHQSGNVPRWYVE